MVSQRSAKTFFICEFESHPALNAIVKKELLREIIDPEICMGSKPIVRVKKFDECGGIGKRKI